MTMALILVGAAPAGRGREAGPLGRVERLEPGRDARPPDRRQGARHRRHGPDRPGGRGAARAPSACRSTTTTATACPRCSRRELDATWHADLDDDARRDRHPDAPHAAQRRQPRPDRRAPDRAAAPARLSHQRQPRRHRRRGRAGRRAGGRPPRRRRPRRLAARAADRPAPARAAQRRDDPAHGQRHLRRPRGDRREVIANIRMWADGIRPPDQVLEGWV